MSRAKLSGIVYNYKEKSYRKVKKGDRLRRFDMLIDFLPSGVIWEGDIGVKVA